MAPLRHLQVHRLSGSANEAPAIREALEEQGTLSAGMRIDGAAVEIIVGACEPDRGQYDGKSTEVTVGDKVLAVFEKVHVLPYQDTFKYNFDYMYNEHLVPFFHTAQVGEFTTGYDFAHKGVRFSVMGVLPEDSYGVVGKMTEIFYEGPAIQRKVLQRLQVVPFEDGLPDRYRPTRLSLDEAALLQDYVRPYFEHRSAKVTPNEVFPIRGVNFKVIACSPSEGGGVGEETELMCKGCALKDMATARAAAAKARPAAGRGSRPPPGASAKALAARRAQLREGAADEYQRFETDREEPGGGGGSGCVVA